MAGRASFYQGLVGQMECEGAGDHVGKTRNRPCQPRSRLDASRSERGSQPEKQCSMSCMREKMRLVSITSLSCIYTRIRIRDMSVKVGVFYNTFSRWGHSYTGRIRRPTRPRFLTGTQKKADCPGPDLGFFQKVIKLNIEANYNILSTLKVFPRCDLQHM